MSIIHIYRLVCQASPYPLILSLENHCTVEQQTVMTKHLCTILGEKLLSKPLNDKLLSSLPSPEVGPTLNVSSSVHPTVLNMLFIAPAGF